MIALQLQLLFARRKDERIGMMKVLRVALLMQKLILFLLVGLLPPTNCIHFQILPHHFNLQQTMLIN